MDFINHPYIYGLHICCFMGKHFLQFPQTIGFLEKFNFKLFFFLMMEVNILKNPKSQVCFIFFKLFFFKIVPKVQCSYKYVEMGFI